MLELRKDSRGDGEVSLPSFKDQGSTDSPSSLKSFSDKLFQRATPSLARFLGALRTCEEQRPSGERGGTSGNAVSPASKLAPSELGASVHVDQE